jgi:hypothetical protein
MRKKILLFILMIVPILAWLTSPLPVFAQVPVSVYIDTIYTGSEAGTASQPYNTLGEGIAFAQAYPGGGYLYIKQPDGRWKYWGYVPPVVVPGVIGGDGEPAEVVTDIPQSPQVTETATSTQDIETPTNSQDTETPASPSITETPASPQVTRTPLSLINIDAPLAKAAVYGFLAILTIGLVLAVYLYRRRLRGP